jgi:hypothetical protein
MYYVQRSFFYKMVFFLRLSLIGPIHTLATALELSNRDDFKSLILMNKNPSWDEFCESESNEVSFDRVREIAKTHGVKTTSVIFAALVGGMRNFMIQSNLPVNENIIFTCPYPLPSHPDALTNHV